MWYSHPDVDTIDPATERGPGQVTLKRAASVLSIPSLHGESFGVALLEMVAARAPVAVGELPGYRQLASGGGALLDLVAGDALGWSAHGVISRSTSLRR